MSEPGSPVSSVHTIDYPHSISDLPPPVDGAESTMENVGLERPPPITHNAKYYLEDEMSVFLVENQLFKVHRHFLIRESQVFQWMFACPPREDGPDGVNDQRPIPLPGVLGREFEALLDFFYRGMRCRCSQFQTCENLRSEVELQRQIDLLSISTRFDFERVRDSAIECIRYGLHRQAWGGQWLAGISPIDRICLAEKYDIPQWLQPSYEDLCQRVAPLEVHEAERIGVRTTTLLARAREAVRNSHLVPVGDDAGEYRGPVLTHGYVSSPSPVPSIVFEPSLYDGQMVARIVREVFYPEIPKKKKKRGHLPMDRESS